MQNLHICKICVYTQILVMCTQLKAVYILGHQKGLMLNEQEHFKYKIKELPVSKTAITLTKKTVGRPSADLSADKMPDFSSFFIGRQKINYNYLVIIFFPSADSFWVLAIGR